MREYQTPRVCATCSKRDGVVIHYCVRSIVLDAAARELGAANAFCLAVRAAVAP